MVARAMAKPKIAIMTSKKGKICVWILLEFDDGKQKYLIFSLSEPMTPHGIHTHMKNCYSQKLGFILPEQTVLIGRNSNYRCSNYETLIDHGNFEMYPVLPKVNSSENILNVMSSKEENAPTKHANSLRLSSTMYELSDKPACIKIPSPLSRNNDDEKFYV